jgi:single-strand DNA-binding protein
LYRITDVVIRVKEATNPCQEDKNMSESINKVRLQGRLGDDPKVTTFEDSGDKLVRFSLATNDEYTTKEGKTKEIPNWHRVAVWDQALVESCSRFRKGDCVQVEGRIESRKVNGEDGDRYFTDISVRPGQSPAHSVKFISSPGARPT